MKKKASVFDSFLLSLAMFTTCPTPHRDYDAATLGCLLGFFPYTGLYPVAVGTAVLALLSLLPLSTFLKAVILLASLVAATGAIHLDGYADTADAVFSRRERDKQLAIMRDPHLGAFGALALGLMLALLLGILSQLLVVGAVRLYVGGFALMIYARALSGFFSLILPSARADGMQQAFRQAADVTNHTLLALATGLSALTLILSANWSGLIAVALVTAWGVLFAAWAKRAYGGATGDLSGCLTVTSEALGGLILAAGATLPLWF